jgi:uncharacterized protein (DUF3084 family)
VRSAAEAAHADAMRETANVRTESDALRQKYATAFQRYQELEAEVSSLEEHLESIAVGLYKPHFR